MKDIKELVTEIALVADGLHVDPKCRDVELCTRLIAAYLAEQEPDESQNWKGMKRHT